MFLGLELATIATFNVTCFSTLPQLDDLSDHPGRRNKGKEFAMFVAIATLVGVVAFATATIANNNSYNCNVGCTLLLNFAST